jgi:pentatricopeptide repeat protein
MLKCGDLEYARHIFDSMRWRNTECWNSMISALASHGQSDEALRLFCHMDRSEQKPNVITLVAVLRACTHGGFVEEGLRIFDNFHVYGEDSRADPALMPQYSWEYHGGLFFNRKIKYICVEIVYFSYL